MDCKHESFRSTVHPFMGSVITQSTRWAENRAAHGGVCLHDTCRFCGATRHRNVNGRHEECGPWEEAALAERPARRAPPVSFEAAGASITVALSDSDSDRVSVTVNGQSKSYYLGQIKPSPECSGEVRAAWQRISDIAADLLLR